MRRLQRVLPHTSTMSWSACASSCSASVHSTPRSDGTRRHGRHARGAPADAHEVAPATTNNGEAQIAEGGEGTVADERRLEETDVDHSAIEA
jgi:hypothetical protein